MKLVLVHTNGRKYGPLAKSIVPPLIPLLNKPIAQHQIERGYASGFKEVVVIASDGLRAVNQYFGDGTRFGVKLDILIGSLSGDECESLLKHNYLFTETIILMAGLILGNLQLSELLELHRAADRRISIIRDRDNHLFIAAIFEPGSDRLLKQSRGDIYKTISGMLHSGGREVGVVDTEAASVSGNGPMGILEMNKKLLCDPSLAVHNPYFESGKGIFLGRGANIHPRARLMPPVLIGHHSQIMAGAEIGPYAVIGDNTVVAKKAVIQSSVILSNSYIGEMTRVEKKIIAQNLLFSADSGEKVVVTDPFLLGKLSADLLSDWLDKLIHRGLAFGIFLSLAPLGLAAAVVSLRRSNSPIIDHVVLGSGIVESSEDLTYLPRINMLKFSDTDPLVPWWPMLINVMKGDFRLIGPRPLTPEEARKLDEPWMLARFKTPPGIAGVADFGEDENERRIAENLYAERRSLILDTKIALAKFAKPLLGRKLAKRFVGI